MKIHALGLALIVAGGFYVSSIEQSKADVPLTEIVTKICGFVEKGAMGVVGARDKGDTSVQVIERIQASDQIDLTELWVELIARIFHLDLKYASAD